MPFLSRARAFALILAISACVLTGLARAQDAADDPDRFGPGGLLEGFQRLPGNEDAYFSGPRVKGPTAVNNVTFALVMANNNAPLYGVQVALQGAAGVFKATTGLNGVAVFPVIAAGTYNLGLIGLPYGQTPSSVPKTVKITKTQGFTLKTALTFPGRTHEWLLFGDSNSIPMPPDPIGYDVMLAADKTFPTFANFALTERDYTLGNTPIAGWPDANNGLEILTYGEAQHPKAAMALIRYGINDVHRYLVFPTQDDINTFRNAYTQAVQTSLAHGILPVLHTLMKETDRNYDTGFDEANKVIKSLASTYHLPLVVANIDAIHNPQYFISDGIHNSNVGNTYLLQLMDQTLMRYFTTGSFASAK